MTRAGRHRRVVPRAYLGRIEALRRRRRQVRSVEPGAKEIGLGSHRGDVDWQGRSRLFTADNDMGVWVRTPGALGTADSPWVLANRPTMTTD